MVKKKNDEDEIGNMLKHVFTSLLLDQKSRDGSSHLSGSPLDPHTCTIIDF